MRRLCLGVAALAVGFVSTSALATEDPIATRKKLMDANGTAAGAAVGMVKGEIPFDPKVAMATLQAMNSVAWAYGDYFPAGSDTGKTKASPKIWEEMGEFQERLAKFRTDTQAALDAKPQDLETFKTLVATIGENCQSCHEKYKLEDN